MWYRQQFTVKGHGEFPLDMLRYDQCWPHSGGSVGSIERSARDLGGELEREVILVRRVDDKRRLPEEGRWKSFGWQVVTGSVLTDLKPS